MARKRTRKKSVRKQIAGLREMLADKDLFLSESYRSALWKLTKVLGQRRHVKLMITYDEDGNTPAAFTNGNLVYLNAANRISRQFEHLEERAGSHEGLIAHECGHIRCSDFKRRAVYVDGFGKGLMYPSPPNVKTAADKKSWDELQEYLRKKDTVALTVIGETAAYLNNVLEDIYIEAFMCREYPGSVHSSIQKNATAVLSQIPTLRERKAEGAGGLTVMLDLIFRYARAGKTTAEAGYLKKQTACLDTCRGIIDEAVTSQNPDTRFHAANQLLLKLWNCLKEEILTVKQDLKHQALCLSKEDLKRLVQGYLNKKITWVKLSHEIRTGKIGEEAIEGWDGRTDGQATDNGFQADEAPEKGKPDETEPEKPDEKLEGLRRELNAMSGDAKKGMDTEPAQSEKTGNVDGGISEKLTDILNEAAKEQYIRQEEKNLEKALKRELRDLKPDDVHKGVEMALHRTVEVTEMQKGAYERIAPKIKRSSARLQKSVEELLVHREGGVSSGLYMGKRLSRNSLYRLDGKIFEKKLLPEEGFSVAFAILVDESGSMELDNRIGHAMETSLVLYDFCRCLAIPVMVCGHSTHDSGAGIPAETVDIFSYGEFDSVDGKDQFRMMDMKDRGGNRDGAALRFVGEHLLKREEEIKILIIISDGDPAAHGYYGVLAKEDLQRIKRDLTRRGVRLFAAAIGDDRAQIESIYKDGFLNISDLNTMPAKLADLLIKYIR